jgi:hypothetical protein
MLFAPRSSPNSWLMRRVNTQTTGLSAQRENVAKTGTSAPFHVHRRVPQNHKKGVFVVEESAVDGDDAVA